MLSGLFHTIEGERAAEGFTQAACEALENAEIRDMYMGCVNEALEGVNEGDLAMAGGMDDDLETDDDLGSQVDSLDECGAACKESDFDADTVDDYDPAIAKTIDAIPPSDPEDVGTFFNDSETAAECGGACESLTSLIDMIPETEIDY